MFSHISVEMGNILEILSRGNFPLNITARKPQISFTFKGKLNENNLELQTTFVNI